MAFRKRRRIWTSHKYQIFGRASSFTHSRALNGMIFLSSILPWATKREIVGEGGPRRFESGAHADG